MGDLFNYAEINPDSTLVDFGEKRGLSPSDLYVTVRQDEQRRQARNDYLDTEFKDTHLFDFVGATWREESLAKAGYDKLVDFGHDVDPKFDPETLIPDDVQVWQREALLEAKNEQHYHDIFARTEKQREYIDQGEYLGGVGTAVGIASMVLHPETMLLGAGEAFALTKIGLKGVSRFAAGASVGALSNTAQELAIMSNNKSRDEMGLLIAAGMGAGFGGIAGMFNVGAAKQNQIKSLIGKEYSRAVKTDFDDAVAPPKFTGSDDVSLLVRGQRAGHILQDPVDGKWAVSLRGTASVYDSKQAAVNAYRKLDETGYYKPQGRSKVVEEPEIEVDPPEEVFPSRAKKILGPLASIGMEGMASANKWVRKLHWDLVEYAPGTGGKEVASHSATLIADQHALQLRSTFHPVRLQGIRDWAKQSGKRILPGDFETAAKFDRAVVEELGYRSLPDTRPKGEINAAVKKVADAYEEVENLRFKMQQDAGVAGYGGLDVNPTHISHKYDTTMMNRLTNSHGSDFVIQLLKKGILTSNEFNRSWKYARLGDKLTPELMDERAGFMAKAIYERMMRRPNTVNLARAAYITKKDRKILEGRLAEAIDNPQQLTHILSSIDGKDSRLLHEYMNQIDLNVNADMDGVKVLDLLDSNLGRNMDSTFRRSAGRTAMAKKGYADQSAFLDDVERAGRESQKMGLDTKEIEDQTTKMQKLWNVVMDESLEEAPDSASSRVMRGLRQVATLSSMSQVGFAQAAELGRLSGHLGVKTFMQQIPQLKNMRRDMISGKFADEFLNDIEAATGFRIGDNELMFHPTLMGDSGGHGIAKSYSSGAMKKTEAFMQQMLHWQSWINGMNVTLKFQQRMHARGFFMNLYDAAQSGTNLKRLADIGLSPEDMKRAKVEMDKYTEVGKGWFGQTRATNMRLSMFEPEIRDKLIMAFHKSQGQTIQRNLGGETPWFAESAFGKLMTQFRTFPMVATEKQLIHDVKFGDVEAMHTLLASFGFGMAAYMSKTYANSLSLDSSKRKKYLKNRMSFDRIAVGATRWMGQGGLTTDVASSGLDAFGLYNPWSYTHNKGQNYRRFQDDLGLDIVPAGAMLNSAYRFTTGLGRAALKGEAVADDTWRHGIRMFPYNNALWLSNIHRQFVKE